MPKDFNFNFPKSKWDNCDLLIIAGEHSGDEQASRILSKLYKDNPDYKVCAFGGKNLKNVGAQLVSDLTEFSVVGLVEVVKNYFFFKKLSETIIAWIEDNKPKAICFIDYPGLNLHLAKMLKDKGLSTKGGGDIKLLYYISPQIWAWKAKRRFKMAKLLDSLAVIFPFETKCYEDTSLSVHFVGHPFLSADYKSSLKYDDDGCLLLLPGSRYIAVKRIFQIMLDTLKELPKEKDVLVMYPSKSIKNLLENLIDKNNLKGRIKLKESSQEVIKAKAVMMSSGTMSLSACLEGIPGAIVYKANIFTYILGRMLVKIKYLSIANILLDRDAWKEFIQFQANAKSLSKYFSKLLTDKKYKEESFANAKKIKDMLKAPQNMDAVNFILSNTKE